MTRHRAKSIQRKFIAAVAAVALLITAVGASQAQAQNRDTERALAAVLGLAVVGAIIAKSRDDDRKSKVVTRGRPDHDVHHDVHRDDRRRRFDRDDRGHDRGHRIAPRPLPPRAQRNLLPAECLRDVRTHRGGTTRVFGGRCLAQNYPFAGSLPRECAQGLDGRRDHHRATVWGAQCLHRNGYRISRR